MASVTETQTLQRTPSTKADVLENRLGPSSRPRVGAFESSPEALSGAINFGIIITVRTRTTLFHFASQSGGAAFVCVGDNPFMYDIW
jgi:hypothetical protein